jgi:hypothetical protein
VIAGGLGQKAEHMGDWTVNGGPTEAEAITIGLEHR